MPSMGNKKSVKVFDVFLLGYFLFELGTTASLQLELDRTVTSGC